jgi:hypothetical protein
MPGGKLKKNSFFFKMKIIGSKIRKGKRIKARAIPSIIISFFFLERELSEALNPAGKTDASSMTRSR